MLDLLVVCCYQFRGSNYVPISLICICYICYVLSCLYIFHGFSLCSPYFKGIKKSSSVCSLLTVALHSALSFLICFCFLESSTGTRSFVLSTTTTRIMLLI